jgi:predicted Zn-dependent peptidase
MMQLTTLANGLRVASRSMPGFETVAVGLYADAGSRHEPAALNGIAHLFEHMVFKGAGGRSARAISETIEDVGGDLNAATDREGTSFSATLLAEHLPLGIELLSDMLLRPHLDAADLVREQEVVLQELAEAEDTPSDIIFDELWTAAFPDQPLGRPVLGSEESVRGITVDNLANWRQTHVCGGSLILVAAGKVEHQHLVDLAEARLGSVPAGSAAPIEAAAFNGGRRALRPRADQAHLTFAYPAVHALDPNYYPLRLFSDIVGSGASSRLFQAVREERGLAYSVWSSVAPYQDCGLFYAYAATARKQAGAAASLMAEVLRAAASDASPRELARAKAQAKAGLLLSLESSWGQASYVARMLGLHNRLVEPADIVRTIDAVTLDQVRAAGAHMLESPRATATIGVPAVKAA